MAVEAIIFRITEAGKNAILDIDNIGLTLRLSHFAIGRGKYTPTGNETQLNSEISRHVISAGDIERTTHTLRFSTSLMANNETEVYEVGIFTQDNVLFALASSESQPLFKIYPDVAFVASFGLMLNEFDDISRVSIITDPNGALSLQLMQQHLASPDPHPQYAFRSVVEQVTNDIITSLRAEIEALKARPIIPIGGLFATTKHYANGEAVTADLGYGKWERALIGRTGVGYDPNAEDWTGTMGQKYGENEHRLTIAEIPEHKHSQNDVFTMFGAKAASSNHITTAGSTDRNNPHSEYGIGNMSNTDWNNAKERTVGENQPHNNVQKSEVIAYWVRMPDNHTHKDPVYNVYWTSDEQGRNKITKINESQTAYLWVDAQNLISEVTIGAVIEGSNVDFNRADLSFPNTIGNGKTKLGHIGRVSVTQDTTISIGISLLKENRQILADLLIQNQVNEIGRRTTTLQMATQRQTYGDGSLDMIHLPNIIVTARSDDEEDYRPKFVEFDTNGNRRLTNNNANQAGFFPSGGAVARGFAGMEAMGNPRLHDVWFYIPATQPFKHIGITSSQAEVFDYRVEQYTGVYNGLYSDNLPENIRTQSKNWIILRANDQPNKTIESIKQATNKDLDINIDF